MFSMVLLLLIVGVAFYSGWLHRRLKVLEAKAGVVAPQFIGVEERRVQQLIQDALRQYKREAG